MNPALKVITLDEDSGPEEKRSRMTSPQYQAEALANKEQEVKNERKEGYEATVQEPGAVVSPAIRADEPGTSFEWKFNWYDISNVPSGMSVKSDVFTVTSKTGSEHKWILELFPNGINAESSKWISIYLTSWSPESVQVTWSVHAVNCYFEKINSQTFREHLYSMEKMSWGFNVFIDRSQPNFLTGVLVNGDLIIHTDLSVKKLGNLAPLSRSMLTHCRPESPAIEDNYDSFLNNQMHSDVEIVFPNGVIYAHRIILANHSPVFAHMLSHEMHAGARQVRVQEHQFTYEVMMEFFRFIYSKRVDRIQVLAEPLLRAADMYRVDRLKIMCEQVILETITCENALFYLESAFKSRAIYLERGIRNFIHDHLEEFKVKPEFQLLSRYPYPESKIFGFKYR